MNSIIAQQTELVPCYYYYYYCCCCFIAV